MRHLLTCLVMAAVWALPLAPAWAGNQEMAESIAASLRDSGQLQSYNVGVRCEDGVVWLKGRVATQEQVNSALRLVYQTPGVTRVVNELTPADPGTATPLGTSVRMASAPANQGDPASQPVVQANVAGSLPSRVAVRPASAVEMRTPNPPRGPLPLAVAQANGAVVPAVPGAAGGAAAPAAQIPAAAPGGAMPGSPLPAHITPVGHNAPAPMIYDQAQMPNYAWPSYAAYPNYAALTYPRQYSPTAWPYIGPFYPYPQVPLGWRKVTLMWDDGWWFLDFKDEPCRSWTCK